MTQEGVGVVPKTLKVLVGGHDQKFWYPLQHELEKEGLFEFREDVWSGHDTHDPARSLELLEWADVIVAEWALGNAVWYSKHVQPRHSLIVRLHLQERDTGYPENICYENVDAVVFVGEHILRECLDNFSIPEHKTRVIGNFVDCEKYRLLKHPEARFNLGMVGILPCRKRLDLAIETLSELLKYDERYCLHVKGDSPEQVNWLWARTAEREYYLSVYRRLNGSSLRNRVVFDPHGDDVASWFKMIGYLLSPSDFESFHMAVAEGAASGAVPIVWNWEGASSVYAGLPLVSDPTEAAAYIHHLSMSAERKRLVDQVSEYVANRYGVENVREAWSTLIREGGPDENSAGSRVPVEKLVVVWAIDDYEVFHRKDMLRALSSNLDPSVQILVVEPGNHYATLLNLGKVSEEELRVIASGRVIRESRHLSRTRLLTGGVPDGVHTSLGQGEPIGPSRILDQLIEKGFGKDIEVIHWVYKPEQVELLNPDEPFVYEVYDDYTLDFGSGISLPEVQAREIEVLSRASHVFFTSHELARRKSKSLQSYTLVSNGVDFDLFYSWKVETERVGRPCVGYLGNLSDFFDWELMLNVVGALPEYDFVLHGAVEIEKLAHKMDFYNRLRKKGNVRFTGWISRESGAAAINRYDVLIIPFVKNDAMLAVNPLKLWEYFATGAPVVSSPIELTGIDRRCLQVVENAAEWVDAIHAAVDEMDPSVRENRIQLAREHGWRELTRDHAAVLRQL